MKVSSVVRFIRDRGTADAAPNERGNIVRRLWMLDDRYMIDAAPDFFSEGWQQFDTDQDAHYFGVWVNRSQRLTLTYAEGDWVLVECPTSETYRAEIEHACRFYGEGYIAKTYSVDDRGTIRNGVTYVQDRAAMFLSDEGSAQ